MHTCPVWSAAPITAAGRFLSALLMVILFGGTIAAAADSSPQPGPDEQAVGSLASPAGPLTYTPGRGLCLGTTHVTIGGYANINLSRDEGHPAQLGLDDFSTFVIWNPMARLHFFSELEFEDAVHVNTNGQGGTPDNQFSAERLYGDFTVADELTVRAGKFLTPVGRWNVIHAQPLVWTTSRPLVTLLPFDTHTTGAALFGSMFPSNGAVTYTLFGQFVNQLDPEPPGTTEGLHVDRSGGTRLEYASGGLSVGGTFLAFTTRGDWQQLAGLDALWRQGSTEVMGEFAYTHAPKGTDTQWGLYLQGVYELVPRFYLVGRYEHFDQPALEPEVNLFVPALAFKPVPYMVLKAEYLIADHFANESPPGLKASFAILF